MAQWAGFNILTLHTHTLICLVLQLGGAICFGIDQIDLYASSSRS